MDPNNNTIPEAPVIVPPTEAAPVGVPEAPVVGVTPEAPVIGVTPEAPVIGATPEAPAIGATPMAGAAPEAPVFNPASMVTPDVNVMAPAPDAATMSDTSSSMTSYGEVEHSFGATDPLTVPEGPKAPDPIEEELKMPLKAAEPVPGSIGSAVSMSSEGVVAEAEKPKPFGKPDKAKSSKTTMILIGVIGAIIIVALVIVLIMNMNM